MQSLAYGLWLNFCTCQFLISSDRLRVAPYLRALGFSRPVYIFSPALFNKGFVRAIAVRREYKNDRVLPGRHVFEGRALLERIVPVAVACWFLFFCLGVESCGGFFQSKHRDLK